MDRAEAYKILSDRLQYFAEDIERLNLKDFSDEYNESLVAENGKTYTLSFKRNQSCLVGTIHDNNNMNFKLLEESIAIEADK